MDQLQELQRELVLVRARLTATRDVTEHGRRKVRLTEELLELFRQETRRLLGQGQGLRRGSAARPARRAP
jgi:hypothetical protein